LFNPLPLLKAELKRTYAGAIAVILLIAIATAVGIAIISQERALRKGSTSAAHEFDIIIGAQGSPAQLVLSTIYLQMSSSVKLVPGSVLADLQRERGVEFAAPIAFVDHYENYLIVGTTSDFITNGGNRLLKEGRLFQSINEVVVGSDVKLPLGKKIAPVHGHYIEDLPISEKDMDEYESHEYTVVGRMPALGTPWDRAIIVPIESVWEIHGLYESHSKKIGPPWKERLPGVPAVVVKPETFSDAYRIKSKYNTESTIAIFPADVLLRFYDLLGNIRDVMAGISIASQILVLTAILLTIFIMLNNRKRQIAVLRAIGASPAYIFSAIWLYTVLLIVIGVVLGIIFGWLSSHFLTAAFSARTGLQMTAVITVRELIMAGSLVFLGMSIAIIPAWMSYRRSVAEGLKSQE
jgi:putative ABC transport system permease protein